MYGHKSDIGSRLPAKQQFNIYLPSELIRRVKYKALDDQLSLSDFVERALIRFLEQGGEVDQHK
jgi:predicted HicB family RNase H-like nuclease